MDEVSVPSRWGWVSRILNIAFGVLAVLSVVFIVWRGYVAESGRAAVPLFGEVTELTVDGHRQSFVLVRFARPETLRQGDLVIRAREPEPPVWRVVRREAHLVRLETGHGRHAQQQEIHLPMQSATPQFILLKPVSSG